MEETELLSDPWILRNLFDSMVYPTEDEFPYPKMLRMLLQQLILTKEGGKWYEDLIAGRYTAIRSCDKAAPLQGKKRTSPSFAPYLEEMSGSDRYKQFSYFNTAYQFFVRWYWSMAVSQYCSAFRWPFSGFRWTVVRKEDSVLANSSFG